MIWLLEVWFRLAAGRVTAELMPYYTTDIDVQGFGQQPLHFIHQKSPAKEAIQLLFVHGEPGSFTEAMKLIPHLTKQGKTNQASMWFLQVL